MTTKAEALLRGEPGQPVDYDDSLIPVRLVERIISREFDDDTEQFVNQVLHFGYGSGAGVLRGALDGRVPKPGITFFALTWGVEMVALTVLELAPPPWRWRRDVLITSMAQHAVFSYVTDRTYRALASDSAG